MLGLEFCVCRGVRHECDVRASSPVLRDDSSKIGFEDIFARENDHVLRARQVGVCGHKLWQRAANLQPVFLCCLVENDDAFGCTDPSRLDSRHVTSFWV